MRVSLSSPLSPAQRSVVPGRRGSAIITVMAAVSLSQRSAAHHAGLAIGHVKLEHGAAGGSIQQGYGGQLRFGRSGYRRWVVECIQDAHAVVREGRSAAMHDASLPLLLLRTAHSLWCRACRLACKLPSFACMFSMLAALVARAHWLPPRRTGAPSARVETSHPHRPARTRTKTANYQPPSDTIPPKPPNNSHNLTTTRPPPSPHGTAPPPKHPSRPAVSAHRQASHAQSLHSKSPWGRVA